MTRRNIDLADAVHGAADPHPASARPSPSTETAASRPDKRTRGPSREGKRGIVIHVEPDMAKRLRHLAVDEETTLQALGVQAFEQLLSERS